MRGLLFGLFAVIVMGLAYWSYSENYKTRDSLRTASGLQREIGSSRETLSVLQAEWAYLNRPERLADLADLNFERLQLLPITSAQFGSVTQVGFPPATFDINELTGSVDVRGQIDPANQTSPDEDYP
ncbi:cell division protein FtsL [uncultured Litoreibacter sp.]|uniref:cell division protein FtsL n=1 Tax=uncultured Litoreibacter sp. TaxID=1392394 RepID=UPI00261A5A9E|nr:cell division protein FtsL [uncultured Litoreibacter sp.]